MELLISEFTNSLYYNSQIADGELKDVCDWTDIQCDTDGRVTHVNVVSVSSQQHPGTLNLALMPPSVTHFSFSMDQVCGTIDVKSLPAGLVVLRLRLTELMHGPIETAHLPKGMMQLDVEMNAFSGELDLAMLPSGLVWLNVSFNLFSGSANLTELPETLEVLHLAENQFSGELNFKSLPESIQDIDISNNRFSGSIVLNNIPPKLWRVIALDCGKMAGTAFVEERFVKQLWLKGTGVTAVVDQHGKAHAMEQQFLNFMRLQWDALEAARDQVVRRR